MMNTKEALEIVRALQTIGDALDMTVTSVGSFVCFYDEAKMATLNEAINLVNAFIDADVVECGRLIGLHTEQCDEGFSTTCVLSDRPQDSPG